MNEATSANDKTAPPSPAGTPRRGGSWRRRLTGVGTVLALAYGSWCAVLYLLQDRIVFAAEWAPEPWPQVPYAGVEVLTFEAPSGEAMVAWFIPVPDQQAGSPAPVVVFFHGNAEIIDYLDEVVAGYQRLGCSILLPEYRGYGRCGGRPSRLGIRADGIRFYDLLIQRDDVDAGRVFFHGRSLGGAIAADLAAHRRPAALILQATFTSAMDMAHRLGAPGFLVRQRYATDRVVASLDIPMLILHGTDDVIIPVAHGRALGRLADSGTYVEYDCGHTDFDVGDRGRAYWSDIGSFLARAGLIAAPDPD